jgi:hypothetical protein
VCHAGPELEEEVKGKEVSGVQFKESESEVSGKVVQKIVELLLCCCCNGALPRWQLGG